MADDSSKALPNQLFAASSSEPVRVATKDSDLTPECRSKIEERTITSQVGDILKKFQTLKTFEELDKMRLEAKLATPFTEIRSGSKVYWVAPNREDIGSEPVLLLMLSLAYALGYEIVECTSRWSFMLPSNPKEKGAVRLRCQLISAIIAHGTVSADYLKSLGRSKDVAWVATVFRRSIVEHARNLGVDPQLFRGHSVALDTAIASTWGVKVSQGIAVNQRLNTLFNLFVTSGKLKVANDMMRSPTDLKAQFLSTEKPWENKGVFLDFETRFLEGILNPRRKAITEEFLKMKNDPVSADALIKDWRAAIDAEDKVLESTLDLRRGLLFSERFQSLGKRKKRTLSLEDKLSELEEREFSIRFTPAYIAKLFRSESIGKITASVSWLNAITEIIGPDSYNYVIGWVEFFNAHCEAELKEDELVVVKYRPAAPPKGSDKPKH